MTVIADGKEIAEKIYKNLKERVEKLKRKPVLSVVITEDNEAGKIYVRNKEHACEKIGIISQTTHFPANISESEILSKIEELNADVNTDAILIQLPLPSHIDSKKILNSISARKDADGFHYSNAGKMFTGQIPYSVACTPKGIIKLLDEYQINLKGLNTVILGRSDIVGKPVAQLLLQRDATVTICHSKTKNIDFYTKNADLIVVAIGKPKFLKADMIKDNAIIIDVGISKVNGKICGDVDFENVYSKASLITPVPGGIGPLTVAMLMQNTVELAEHNLITDDW